MDQRDAGLRIDQFTAREACSVLAALRVFQQVRAAGGEIPSDSATVSASYSFTGAGVIEELEHFEDAAQLSDSEIDALCERIAIEWYD